jgi:hypothetical protein
MHLLQKEKNKRKSVAVMEVDQREKGRLLGVVQTCGSSKEWSRQARERRSRAHTHSHAMVGMAGFLFLQAHKDKNE